MIESTLIQKCKATLLESGLDLDKVDEVSGHSIRSTLIAWQRARHPKSVQTLANKLHAALPPVVEAARVPGV